MQLKKGIQRLEDERELNKQKINRLREYIEKERMDEYLNERKRLYQSVFHTPHHTPSLKATNPYLNNYNVQIHSTPQKFGNASHASMLKGTRSYSV